MTTKSVVAYETWHDGNLVGIRNTIGNIIVSSDPDVLLGFLANTGYDCIHVFWNLDESISSILRLLPLETLQSLHKHEPKLSYNGCHLYYLNEKSAQFGTTRYYGIRTFWSPNELEPTTLEDTQSRANLLLETLAQLGIPDIDGLVTPVYVFERSELGRKTYNELPPEWSLPEYWDSAFEYANKADHKHWIACYRIGRFNGLFDYDINSCYGNLARSLLDLHDCELWHSDKLGKREMGAYYGFVKGRFYINPKTAYLSPIVVKADAKEHVPSNLAGWLPEDVYEINEVRTVDRYGLGTFKMVDGWFIMPRSGTRPSTPFKSIMDNLYSKRHWSPLANTIAKSFINQIIGKLVEIKNNGEYSPIYNGVYHAIITSRARCEITDFLIQNDVAENELVVVQTDGCRLKKEIPVQSNGMGSWRCNGAMDTIVVSPTKIWTGDKKPSSMVYADLIQLIGEHPRLQSYGKGILRRTTLSQAVSQGEPSRVGMLHDVMTHLELLNMDRGQTRLFKKFPTTGKSLLDTEYGSDPIVLDKLIKMV